MATPKRFSQLPRELSSKNLMPLAQSGEPTVVLMLSSVGNTSPFRMQGRTNRTFYFAYDRAKLCHILHVPLSIWQAEKMAMARELLDQRLHHPVLVDVIATTESPEVDQSEIEELILEKADLIVKVAELTKEVALLKGEPVPEEVLEILKESNAEEQTTTEPEQPLDPDGNPVTEFTPEQIEQMKQALTEQPVDPASAATDQHADVIVQQAEGIAQIKALLPIRLNALAEKLGKSPEEVRAIIEAPESGLIIKNAGWVGVQEE